MLIEVATAEVADKFTILCIKAEMVTDTEKRKNVIREKQYLESVLKEIMSTIEPEVLKLREVNLVLWGIEDKIRCKEAKQEFDDEFIELARAVYFTNDQRYEVKRRINEKASSEFVEEKQYVDYRGKDNSRVTKAQ